MVETRLENTAQVMRRLPPVRVGGYFNTWPAMFADFADRVGQGPQPMRLPPAVPLRDQPDGEDAQLITFAQRQRTLSSSGRARSERRGKRSAGGSASDVRPLTGNGNTGSA